MESASDRERVTLLRKDLLVGENGNEFGVFHTIYSESTAVSVSREEFCVCWS